MKKNAKLRLTRQKGNRVLPNFSNDCSENQNNDIWLNPNLVDDHLKAELAPVQYSKTFVSRHGVPKIHRYKQRRVFSEPDDFDTKKWKNRDVLLNNLLEKRPEIKETLLDNNLHHDISKE